LEEITAKTADMTDDQLTTFFEEQTPENKEAIMNELTKGGHVTDEE